MIRIGIDPDINKSGVAIMVDGRLKSLESMGFHDLMDGIRGNFEYRLKPTMTGDLSSNVAFYVEDVELIKTVWDRPRIRNQPDITQPAKIKIAQNVGMVKAVGRLIGQQFERCEIPFTLIPPLKGYLKRGKKDAEFFNRLMSWSGRSNADSRDAALLLYEFYIINNGDYGSI